MVLSEKDDEVRWFKKTLGRGQFLIRCDTVSLIFEVGLDLKGLFE